MLQEYVDLGLQTVLRYATLTQQPGDTNLFLGLAYTSNIKNDVGKKQSPGTALNEERSFANYEL